MDNIYSRLDNLEREIWNISKEILPQLGHFDTSEIDRKLQSFEDKLKKFEQSGGMGASFKVATIYDMTSDDPSINQGKTGGVTVTNYVEFDESAYDFIRVYVTLPDNTSAFGLFPIKNRSSLDNMVVSCNATGLKLFVKRINLYAGGGRIVSGTLATYTTSLDGTVSVSVDVSGTNHYISKVEGIVEL